MVKRPLRQCQVVGTLEKGVLHKQVNHIDIEAGDRLEFRQMPSRTSVSKMSIYVEAGRRIRDIRRASGISQERLASAIGLSRTSITNIERGRQKLLLHTVSEIAAILKVPVHDLVPNRSDMKSKIDAQLPSDTSPKLRKLISSIVENRSSKS